MFVLILIRTSQDIVGIINEEWAAAAGTDQHGQDGQQTWDSSSFCLWISPTWRELSVEKSPLAIRFAPYVFCLGCQFKTTISENEDSIKQRKFFWAWTRAQDLQWHVVTGFRVQHFACQDVVVDSPKIFMQVDVLESQRPYKYTAYSERIGKRKHRFPMDFHSNQPAKKVVFHVFFNVERCF